MSDLSKAETPDNPIGNGLKSRNGFFGRYQYYVDLVYVLTRKEFKIRYKSSLLGYLWSILNPICLALIYFLAFKIFMRIRMEHYLVFLLSGLFPWQWVANTVGPAPNNFLGNPSLIKKVNFPVSFIVLVNTMQNMIHFLLSIPAFVIFLVADGLYPDLLLWIWAVPVLLVVTFFMIMGMSLIVATVNIFFRDIEHLNTIILQMLFFGTPIIYSLEMIPQEYVHLMLLNPYTPLFVTWNGVLYKNLFNAHYFFIALGVSALFFGIGYTVYRRLSWKFAEVL